MDTRTEVLLNSLPSHDAAIVEMILAHEGGTYTNHPADKGGPTKWGITIPVLRAHRGRFVDASDIQALTRDEAAEIYTRLFIRPFDGLPDTVRSNVIDMGVNAGVDRAARLLQQCIGVDVDGRVGPVTRLVAISRDWNPFYVGFRLSFYESILTRDPSQAVFRKGWRARALSFYGTPRLRATPRYGLMTGDPTEEPAYGFMGKAILL